MAASSSKMDFSKGKNTEAEEYVEAENPKKIVSYYIRDLQTAKKVNDYFVIENIPFKEVNICGMVVEKRDPKDENPTNKETVSEATSKEENLALQVDDGTGSIRCLISDQQLQRLKNSTDIKKHRDHLKNYEQSELTAAIDMTLKRLLRLRNTVPAWDEIKLADMVHLTGRMKEYNNGRYIFIDKLSHKPHTPDFFDSYLTDLIEKYEETNEANRKKKADVTVLDEATVGEFFSCDFDE